MRLLTTILLTLIVNSTLANNLNCVPTNPDLKETLKLNLTKSSIAIQWIDYSNDKQVTLFSVNSKNENDYQTVKTLKKTTLSFVDRENTRDTLVVVITNKEYQKLIFGQEFKITAQIFTDIEYIYVSPQQFKCKR